jgi:hypothetical protein
MFRSWRNGWDHEQEVLARCIPTVGIFDSDFSTLPPTTNTSTARDIYRDHTSGQKKRILSGEAALIIGDRFLRQTSHDLLELIPLPLPLRSLAACTLSSLLFFLLNQLVLPRLRPPAPDRSV